MLFAPDTLWILLGALLLDALVGDPDWLWRRLPHPVVWLGRLIALGDATLNREAWTRHARKAAGILWLGLILSVSLGAGWLLDAALRALPGGPIWIALIASTLIALRSLHQHAARVRDALPDGLAAARSAVSMIVGRETAALDEAGVSRAAIESAAENFSDGVVAPVFWFAIAGLPGLVAYKAVNTADSMIGHLSIRHRDFGWASARLDDLLNLVPARLSALFVAIAAPMVGGSILTSLRTAWRDAGTHRSPNAGWPEAAMAGALGLSLGGPRIYAAGPVDAPYLHAEGRRDAGREDIARSLRILSCAAAAQMLLIGLAAWMSH